MIEIEATPKRTDPSAVSGMLQTILTLAPSVHHVKAGTPLRPSSLGWVPATDGMGHMVAIEGKYGGESLAACRAAIIDVKTPTFTPGAGYFITSVDDIGICTYRQSSIGPFIALSERLILIDMGVPAVVQSLLTMTKASKE